MRRTDTKERILQEALRLFSERGYEAVGMDEIAAAVGIKTPSIYSHFKGKQDLVDRLISISEECYAEHSMLSVELDDAFFATLTKEKLSEMVCRHISYLVENENHKNVNRMLQMGQYLDERMRKLIMKHKYTEPLAFARRLVEGLKNSGQLRKIDDVDEAALLIVAPIMFMLQQCDLDEKLKKNISQQVEWHIRNFWQMMS